MDIHKIETRFTEDGILVLEGLPFHAGDAVEIIILKQTTGEQFSRIPKPEHSLQGTVLRYDEPFEPAIPPEDWETLK
ncbi:hypothetical protein C7B61_04160 [filamentous cyanobacterium CCP1]|nr:hypothetical protein C7B76_15030 [filamentous cyanobacterium CCP2]PSB67819.1 hypothetical protein C7B61_04160 [filamentous cyanobacterium CCP1]